MNTFLSIGYAGISVHAKHATKIAVIMVVTDKFSSVSGHPMVPFETEVYPKFSIKQAKVSFLMTEPTPFIATSL